MLASLPPDSSEQQALVAATADRDGFNWGYDPLHYNVPEGSYATDADGSARILEFRQMVQSLNQSGLRVVMDVVYNHTNSAGQNPNSILDKLVPGYYHRLNGDGVVLGESCCADTATEHAMMEKLMVDSVVQWAQAVQGRRLPLRHHGLSPQVQHAEGARGARRADAGEGRRRRQVHLSIWRSLELRRHGQQRPRRERDPGEHGRHRHRLVLRSHPRRGARRRTVQPAARPGLRDRPVRRAQRHLRRIGGGREGGAAAAHRLRAPGAGRQHRQLSRSSTPAA